MVMENSMESVVRRLTPIECARLQNFPDDWCEIGEWTDSKGKLHKDSDGPKYKAYGNSIARPYWRWLLRNIAATYNEPLTMGSLFSGIGGFELCSLEAGIKPLWASEIEDFCVAVTTKHFGDEDKGIEGDYEKYLQTKHHTDQV